MKEIIVTDHALVRWLERVREIDVEAIRDEIRSATATAMALGARQTVVDGACYVLNPAEHKVITVTTAAMKAQSRGVLHKKHRPSRGWLRAQIARKEEREEMSAGAV